MIKKYKIKYLTIALILCRLTFWQNNFYKHKIIVNEYIYHKIIQFPVLHYAQKDLRLFELIEY